MSRHVCESLRNLDQAASSYRLPFRLNWFVLLNNSKARASSAGLPKGERQAPVGLFQEIVQRVSSPVGCRDAPELRILCNRKESSS